MFGDLKNTLHAENTLSAFRCFSPSHQLRATEIGADELHDGAFEIDHGDVFVHDQCFELVEVQVAEDTPTALKLCQSLGFEQADVGRIYQRQD